MDTERQPVPGRSFNLPHDLLARPIATGSEPVTAVLLFKSQVRPRRDARYWLIRVCLCLPLVSLFSVWLALVFYPAPRIATGDPLTDEVLRQAVRYTQQANARVRAENLYTDLGRPGSLADRLEHSLPEARWSRDPHWWELEYQLRQSVILQDRGSTLVNPATLNSASGVATAPTPPQNDSHTEAEEAQHTSLLAQSRQAAQEIYQLSRSTITSAPLLLQELRQDELAWEDEGRAWYRVGFPDRGQDRSGYWKLVRYVTKQHHSVEETALLAALRAAAPDEALPCYWEARLAFMDGDLDKAMGLIAEGNAKAQCSQLELYPAPQLDAALAAGEPLADQPASSALLALLHRREQDNLSALESWRPIILAMAATVARQQDTAGLRHLMRMVARLGSSATDAGCGGTWISIDTDLVARILKEWPGTPPDALLKEAGQSTKQLSLLSQEIKAVILSRNQLFSSTLSLPLGKLVAIGRSRLDFGEFSSAYMSKFAWDTASREQQLMQTKVKPLWQELAQPVSSTAIAAAGSPGQT